MLPDPYPVQPWTRPCRGSVELPGSKSLTNRALVLAALAGETTQLTGALFSRDTRILVSCLKALGFKVDACEEDATIRVDGNDGRIPNREAKLFVGNAGTAARFLTALVCLHPDGSFELDGDEEMRLRPMGGLIEALEALGARFTFHGQPGRFPFRVRTSGLPSGPWKVDAKASSQMLSALMMVAPLAPGAVFIQASGARPAFVEMTASLMRQFGAAVHGSPAGGYRIAGNGPYCSPSEGQYAVEPDATAASYFMILPLITGGEVFINRMSRSMVQGDIRFASIVEDLGLLVKEHPEGWRISHHGPPSPGSRDYDFQTFSDTFLTLAAVAPLLPFPVTIRGIEHTRNQETDRIHAMATELARLGARVEEHPGAIRIEPFAKASAPALPVRIQTYRDHRVAMSFGVLGSSSRFGPDPWLLINDPACCGKTFPGFFGRLEDLYRLSHDK